MRNLIAAVGGGKLRILLIVSFSLIASITISVGAINTSRLIRTYLENAENARVSRDMDLAQAFYEIKLRDITGVSYRLATDAEIIQHFEAAIQGNAEAHTKLANGIERNIVTPTCHCLNGVLLLDANGNIVVGKTQSRLQNAPGSIETGNWSKLTIVQSTLTRKISNSGTEVIPAELLAQIGLEEQAKIEMLPTDRAAEKPFDPREGTAGFALVSTYPINNDQGELLGTTLTLYLFNNDTELVDHIRDVAGIDTVTIFFGDLRVATNVLNEDGSRAIGTRVSQEVHDTVLTQGNAYQGRAFVVNEWYITRYDPLHNHHRDVVGSLYVGARVSAFQNLIRSFNQNVATIAILSIILAGIIAIPIAKLITRPIDDLVLANRRLARGDLLVQVADYGNGELGMLAKSFNKMVSTLHETQLELLHKEKLASMGQLAAGVAHEINNPLGTILLFSDILHKEMEADDPRKSDLEMIINETNRCQKIVGDLLNFSRQQELLTQDTQINDLLNGTLELVSPQPAFANVEISRQYSSGVPHIQADPAQLQQVFNNLLNNAADAMPKGGEIKISTQLNSNQFIEIQISDTGEGIPKENLSKLFTPFFTTKGPGKGTGLGLSIAYGIVKMHRGQISIRSEVHQGTIVTVLLPTNISPFSPAASQTIA